MPRLRMLVLAVLLSLVAAACSDDLLPDLEVATGEPVPEQSEDTPTDPDGDQPDEPADDSGGTGDAGDQGDQGGHGDQGGDQGGDQTTDGGGDDGQTGGDQAQAELTALSDDGAVGANGPAYLRGDRPRVVLEIDVQDGVNLPASVVDHVASVLARESNATVEVRQGAATTTQRDAWTADQLRAAAAETRSVGHSDDTAVIHLLALRGGFEQDRALGVAFGSSAAAVFPDQWSDLATVLLSGDRIARAVTTHEVGHLLGLVGLHEPPTSDHEDPQHPGHTTDRDDVMYWAVETDLIGTLDGVPTDFGPLTRADLAAMREG